MTKEKPPTMPTKNYWFEQLPKECDVEERSSGKNSYYVAIIEGVEGVVCWSTNTHPNAQTKLDKMVKDTLQRRKVAAMLK